jgi:hypothetical protein
MEEVDSVISGDSGTGGMAFAIDTSSIITKLVTIKEARSLPAGAIVGDLHGGLTFTDAVAAALESRSASGWREIQARNGEIWTIIIVNR